MPTPSPAGVARNVLGLQDAVLPAADGGGQEMVLGRAGIRIGVADQRAFLRIGQRPGVERIDQLAGFLGRQVPVVGVRAVVPPIGLGVAVPGIPDALPGAMIGRRHFELLEEGKLPLQGLESGDRLVVVGIGDRDDAVAILRIVQLVERDHGRAHDRFLFMEDRIEQHDQGIVLLRSVDQILLLVHIDPVDRPGEDVAVHEEGQRVEALRDIVEREQQDGRECCPPDVERVQRDHGASLSLRDRARSAADPGRSSSFLS